MQAVLVVLALCAAVAQGYPMGTYTPTSISKVPINMVVDITAYNLKGVSVPVNGPPCTAQPYVKFGLPCLQTIDATQDGVTFTYDFNATFSPAFTPVSVNAYLCFSSWSQIGRSWRYMSAAKDIMTDKSCNFMKATQMLPAAMHTATKIPAEAFPSSTVYVRTIALCNNATSTSPGTRQYPCGRGRSPGYFQVQRIKSRTAVVEGSCAGVMVGGLLLVLLAVFIDRELTKRHKRL